MNKTKKLVASISTILRQTHFSNLRFNPIPTIAINSQTHLSFRETLEPNGLRLAGRVFCSESGVKKSSCFKCWNCGVSSEKAAFLFCDSCRSIQPFDDSVDYFQIFGLENKYEIDDGSLEGKYKDWQKKLHPDLVHNKSKKERDYAADQSAKVTEACRTLTKPLSRAMYIIMELREAIAEANDSNELNQIRSQVQEKLKQWSDSFVEAFESQKFDEAVKCIQRMTYYERACEEAMRQVVLPKKTRFDFFVEKPYGHICKEHIIAHN